MELKEVKVTFCPELLNSKNIEIKTLKEVLLRIKKGASKELIEKIRNSKSGVEKQSLKSKLPSVLFVGEFKERKQSGIEKYSGFAILDFDKVFSADGFKKIISEDEYIFASWISPSGDGVKALVKISEPEKYVEHYQSLLKHFPDADKSTKDISRTCFESYDPEIYINPESKVFEEKFIKEVSKVKQDISLNDNEVVEMAIKWCDKHSVFVTGNRNNHIFKLACLLSEFGMPQSIAEYEIKGRFDLSGDEREFMSAIRSAYKGTQSKFGSIELKKSNFVNKETQVEVDINSYKSDVEIIDDVVLFSNIEPTLDDIFQNGYKHLRGISVMEIDKLWKPLEGEITLVSGYANYGKSNFVKWYFLMRALLYDEKYAFYDPETSNEDFIIRLAEMLIGCYLPGAGGKETVSKESWEMAKEFIKTHFIQLDMKSVMPTPQNILSLFGRLKIIERINGVVIDPFNQMENDYSKAGGRSDKYLETTLGLFTRFARENKLYFVVVAHPSKPARRTAEMKNYPCPDYYDIADGAMWANKMDNILIYHRPFHQELPEDNTCELHTKKIRKQQTVGSLGDLTFNFDFKKKRYIVNHQDPMQQILDSLE